MIGAGLDNWCDRVFFVGIDKVFNSLLNTLDKIWILTDRATQTDDIWIDEILDIEQALRQIAVHALNGFLTKSITSCGLLVNLATVPISMTRFFNHVSYHIPS
ncbi:Uncharacterised protein [Streptococcus pneumoniae]|nr:Uncharacterised protein [Streptococcus pneumoniae]